MYNKDSLLIKDIMRLRPIHSVKTSNIKSMGRFCNLNFTQFSPNGLLKGVFAKNERGYRLNAIKKRF